MKYSGLIVEDDPDIAILLQVALNELDIKCVIQNDGKQGLQRALTSHFDLILLDVMLPSLSGLDICKAVREKKPDQVIMMITAKNSELDRVLGLDLGADDYIDKPFSVLELQARLKGQLRKIDRLNNNLTKNLDSNKANENCIDFDGLFIDTKKRIVKVDGNRVELTAIEFDLLVFFAKSPSEIFSRNDLLDKVWGYQHSGYEHTVSSHINRLRTKIEINTSEPKWIHTVWGVGYKFCNDQT